MASYNEAQVITQLKNAVKPFEIVRVTCESSSPNVLGLEDTLTQSLHSDYANEISGNWDSARGKLSDFLGTIGEVLSPIWRTWAQILTTAPDLSPSADDQTILSRIYDRMITSGDRITSRGFAFATPSLTGSANGSLKRLTQDENNLPIENVYPELKVAKCTFDANGGTNKHQEQFEVRGTKAKKDLLKVEGSGLLESITAKSAEDSILTNASFAEYDDATTPTTINGWTPTSSISNFAIDTTNYYRGFGSDDSSTHQSLQIKANDSIYQSHTSFRAPLAAGVPVYSQLAYNRQVNSCNDGTLTFQVGAASTSVVLAAQTGWNILALSQTSANSWLKNLNQQDLKVQIGLSGSTTFDVLVDDVLVVFYDYADGWYCAIGGSTPFLKNEYFSWTDTAVESVIQRWVHRGTSRCLPAALASPTTAAATGAQSATAGVCTVGDHRVGYTFVDGAGNESGLSSASATFTLADSLHTVDVTGLPASCPANIVTVKIYMSKASAPTGTMYYTGRSVSAGTTTATGASGVNVADASLTVAAPAGVTIAEP